ncbi:hypothetical protein COU57_00805 [Candidatus Pacearchaeota archaeon CG10_big_fil_rev_8_21_14_0_10_32_14]|nr:MAG: hypothetical protein COU57_00805 [Candidatus Pacearchaeota archaeon CG10_big_fil_rev_8_21_14_0_10_32_14]
MKKSYKKRSLISAKTLFGSAFLLIGIFLISNSNQFTGFVSYSNESIVNYTTSGIGIILVISGIFLIFLANRQETGKLEKGLDPNGIYAITQAQKERSVGTYKDLKSMAEKAGYVVEEGKNGFKLYHPDGTSVKTDSGKIVSIPKDAQVSRELYLRIVKELSEDADTYSESRREGYRKAA